MVILNSLILLSGVANICAVTYDRYVAIIKPLLYPYLAPMIFKRTLVVSWLIPTIYSLPPLAWDTNRTKTINIVYVVCLEFFGVVVPYIFITFAYVRIFRKVRHILTMRKNFESARQQRKKRRRVLSDAQVAKVFCIVSTTFLLIGSLSTRVFEMRTVTGSELFLLLTCPHTTTFTKLSIFSPLETSSINIWETILS